MAVSLYDNALAEKIGRWVKDPNLRILKPNEVTRMLQIASDDSKDKPLSLPMIALSREPTVTILNPGKRPHTFDGMLVEVSEGHSLKKNVIPISLSYQLDIYTRRYDEGDEYMRNFVFNFTNYPKLQIFIPYNNIQTPHNANIRLDPNIEDNSDIPNRLFSGQFTRWTLKLTIDDACLFSIPEKDNLSIEATDVKVDETTNTGE